MDIYQFAKQMELDGERYYRTLADQSESAGLQKIFLMLAAEEVKHYKVIDLMSRGTGQPELAETEILDQVRNVFAGMREGEPDLRVDSTAATQNYRKARDIEEQSKTFYLEQAARVENALQAEIFSRLAKEEEKHLRIMEHIVEFVSRPEPGNWLENAEWHHLENY